ncbi:MAG: gamma-glutamyltransferase, partial [Rhodospirillaceae bacterium]
MLTSITAFSGMVHAPHPFAAQAGLAVLRAGGNAVEAAVAVGAALSVACPNLSSLGGDGVWLVSEPGQYPLCIMAIGPAAQGVNGGSGEVADLPRQPGDGGPAALTVAGLVGGWAKALSLAERWGRPLPLSDLFAEAMRLAKDGVPVSPSLAGDIARDWDRLNKDPGAAGLFGAGGEKTAVPVREGARLKQAALARTFDWLSKAGLDDFYRGDLARSLVASLERSGSILGLEDLERWHPTMGPALSIQTHRGVLAVAPPPTRSLAGLMTLGIWDQAWSYRQREAARAVADPHTLLAQASNRADQTCMAALGDPAAMSTSPEHILAVARLKEEAETLRTNSMEAPASDRGDLDRSVWFGVADRTGRMVTVQQGLNRAFGCALVLSGTGVLWQNRRDGFTSKDGANPLLPGRMPRSGLCPGFWHGADDYRMVLGVTGNRSEAMARILTELFWFAEDPHSALSTGSVFGAPSMEPERADNLTGLLMVDPAT